MFVISLIEEELEYRRQRQCSAESSTGQCRQIGERVDFKLKLRGVGRRSTQHQKGRGGIRRFWAVVNPGWSHRCTWQRVLFISVNGPAVKQFWYITYTCFSSPSRLFWQASQPPPSSFILHHPTLDRGEHLISMGNVVRALKRRVARPTKQRSNFQCFREQLLK